MTFLFCALVVILGLAILNGIACWFGWDVAQEAEAPAAGSHVDEAHGDEARGTPAAPLSGGRPAPREPGLEPASHAAGSSRAAIERGTRPGD